MDRNETSLLPLFNKAKFIECLPSRLLYEVADAIQHSISNVVRANAIVSTVPYRHNKWSNL